MKVELTERVGLIIIIVILVIIILMLLLSTITYSIKWEYEGQRYSMEAKSKLYKIIRGNVTKTPTVTRL